ncbi:Hypothetical predicted protein, partial [Pelobates cultripes]
IIRTIHDYWLCTRVTSGRDDAFRWHAGIPVKCVITPCCHTYGHMQRSSHPPEVLESNYLFPTA